MRLRECLPTGRYERRHEDEEHQEGNRDRAQADPLQANLFAAAAFEGRGDQFR